MEPLPPIPLTLRLLSNFCYFWDLQAGVLIASWIVIAVYSLSFGLNVILENGEEVESLRRDQYTVTYGYLCFSILAAFCAFFGMITENRSICAIGIILLLISFIAFLVLFLLSYTPRYWRTICIDGRCPDTIWFYQSAWRLKVQDCPLNSRSFPVGPKVEYYSKILNKTELNNFGLINDEINNNGKILFEELNEDYEDFAERINNVKPTLPAELNDNTLDYVDNVKLFFLSTVPDYFDPNIIGGRAPLLIESTRETIVKPPRRRKDSIYGLNPDASVAWKVFAIILAIIWLLFKLYLLYLLVIFLAALFYEFAAANDEV
ncbi:hypothetical protein O3M35_012098 [Rhynocoris fuscipes]|uniref:Tetraspanin n=1 Tax=Rhynocoris fuscipes TaxID=488301 RepID=A0AAW1CSK5_9HEMI